jgi:hypothetical protein
MAAGRVLVRVDSTKGPLAWGGGLGVGWGFGRGVEAWGGGRGALAWVRDRGEHYLLRPQLLAGINVLAVGSLAIYILVSIPLSVSVVILFSVARLPRP